MRAHVRILRKILAMPLRTALFASAILLAPALAAAAEPLVTPAWLNEHLRDQHLVVLDVRDVKDGSSADLFAQGHIPGAVHSDYAKAGWRATVDGVAGMLPPVADVEALIGGLGIGNGSRVVIVPQGQTSSDFGAATRVYWTFDVMGDDNVSILKGGYAGWQAAGLPVETGPGRRPDAVAFDARFRPELIATTADVQAAQKQGLPLIDARPQSQYTGAETAANVGVAGTIPGAVSLPNGAFVTGGTEPIDASDVSALIAKAGLQPTGEKITFCNTGHWASVDWFMLNKVGGDKAVKLYDGSMATWAKADGLPTEIGAGRTVN